MRSSLVCSSFSVFVSTYLFISINFIFSMWFLFLSNICAVTMLCTGYCFSFDCFSVHSPHTHAHTVSVQLNFHLSPSVLFSHFVRLFLFMLFVHCCFYSFSFVPCNVMESYVSSEKQNNGEKKNDFNVHSSNFPSLSCYFLYALFHPFISALFCCFFFVQLQWRSDDT